MTEAEAAKKLKGAGWIPQGNKLGEGGGGFVFRCLSSGAFNRTKHLAHANANDGVVPEFLELLANAINGESFYGAGKVAKRPDSRLKREITALDTVRHPHLVRLLAFDKDAEPSWYVMELLQGPLSIPSYAGRIADVFRGLLTLTDATAALHAAGYLHRDIKPNNVYLRRTGEWVLGDLGIALEQGGADLTLEATTPASRDWIPPWRIAPGRDHPPTWDLYMLTGLALALCFGTKVKEPSWLGEQDVDLTAKYPGQPGIVEAWQFFQDHFVQFEAKFASPDVATFRARVVAVFEACAPAAAAGATLLHSWRHDTKLQLPEEMAPVRPLRDLAVYSTRPLSRLHARIDAAPASPNSPITWHLEFFDSAAKDWKLAGRIENAVDHRTNGWSESPLVATLALALPTGWNRLRLVAGGGGLIRAATIYGE